MNAGPCVRVKGGIVGVIVVVVVGLGQDGAVCQPAISRTGGSSGAPG